MTHWTGKAISVSLSTKFTEEEGSYEKVNTMDSCILFRDRFFKRVWTDTNACANCHTCADGTSSHTHQLANQHSPSAGFSDAAHRNRTPSCRCIEFS